MPVYTWFVILLALGLIGSSLCVLFARRLNIVITAIGMGSLFLSVIFFLFNAPFAGAFELSVGAGLMSVLFIIATSLTRESGETE
jgi:NADH:ubiquinone oxidoreductase subunit 6 (subunit J)